MTQAIDSRRYDIDWLRTLAFGLLILYHVGMYYVADWDWHIKSAVQSIWLQDLMVLTNQWRMSLLFFISGIALAMVRDKFSAWQLLNIRSQRLLVPLIFGMLVIVPPQLYFELQGHQQFSGSYLAFMAEYLNLDTSLAPHKQSAIGLLTWHHLWFLPYLWCYSLIYLGLSPMLSYLHEKPVVKNLSLNLFFSLLVIGLFIIWFLLRQHFPSTYALIDDWYNHGKYFLVFLAGSSLVKLPIIWQQIIGGRRHFLMLAIIAYVLIIMDRHQVFTPLADQFDTSLAVKSLYGIVYISNHWAWIFALVGYAGRYLQFSNGFLRYASEAILPWYILHQTLIILFAMILKELNIPAPVEAPLLIVLTVAGCLLGYELIRRTRLSCWLFGLKLQRATTLAKQTMPQPT